MPFPTRTGLLSLAFAAACAEAPEPPDPGAPRPADGAAALVTATGVELRLPQPGGGDVVIAGDSFRLDPDRGASLEGGVRVRSDRGMRFEAAAARASLSDGGRIAVLEGGVFAVLSLDRAPGDAGAADD